MKEITGNEFYELLKLKTTNEISNYIITFKPEIHIDINEISQINYISNCSFKGKIQIFDSKKNEILDNENCLIFNECIFQDVVVSKCFFDELKFTNITSEGKIFSIADCQIYEFEISTSLIESETFAIHHNKFITQFHLKNLTTGKNSFLLRKNKFPVNQNRLLYTCYINSCQFFNCDIFENDFAGDMIFTSNILTNQDKNSYSSNNFKKCNFEKSNFYGTDFGEATFFTECTFNNGTLFENTKNDLNTILCFKDISFKNTVSFNNSIIHKLNFENCVFENSSFFQNTYFDILKLDKSIFEKSAFFDDIQIKKIDKCDRRTIRNIKLHLQKAENKIDYNKFRVFEFEAYKADLRKQIIKYNEDKNHFYHRVREIKHLRRDLFILKITGFYSDYGTDWKKSLKWTLLLGLILYTLFFISENHTLKIDENNWQTFPIGSLDFSS